MLKRLATAAPLIAAVAVSACGSSTVKTVTERVTTPATAPPATSPPATTHTVYRTPTACIELAHSASRLASIFGVLFKQMAPLPELVKEAAAAGLQQNEAKILSIGAKTQAIDADIARAAEKVHDLDSSLHAAPGSCS